MTRAVRVSGALAAFGYLVVLLLTRFALPGGARPLYDGFSPPAPYRWVNPPKALAATNQSPSTGNGAVAKADGKDATLAFETPDGQASVTAEIAALALTGSETGATGELVPLDPAAYGPLPSGVAPSGNVYRLSISTQPDARDVTTFAKPVSVALELANSAGTDMYTSSDGKAWTKLKATVGQPFVLADAPAPGYFVLAGPAGLLPSIEPRATPATKKGTNVALWIGGGVALLLVAGVALLLRRGAR